MDDDQRVVLRTEAVAHDWMRMFQRRRDKRLTTWVSKFHPQGLTCTLGPRSDDFDFKGSFNIGTQVVFESGEKWLVRFPFHGRVCLTDEKVEAEVAAMRIVRQKTNVPVPEVKAWGLSADNELGLGPFIMMDFVEGVSLGEILMGPNATRRYLRTDVDDGDIEHIYRQIVRFQLQLSRLDFAYIGSVASSHKSAEVADHDNRKNNGGKRCLTWRAHAILRDADIDVLGSPTQTFNSTKSYFHHIVDGNLKQLHEQPNSTDNEEDARLKFQYWNVLKKLVDRHVLPEHDQGPFKLLCDDFGPANMIVKSETELDIVSVIDWEWAYSGPSQLFWTPPRWLILSPPDAWWDHAGRLARYQHYLQLYMKVLEEEESALCDPSTPREERPSHLMERNMADGRLWFHHILLGSFHGPLDPPFQQLKAATPDFDDLVSGIEPADIEAFVAKKRDQMKIYDVELAEARKTKEARDKEREANLARLRELEVGDEPLDMAEVRRLMQDVGLEEPEADAEATREVAESEAGGRRC